MWSSPPKLWKESKAKARIPSGYRQLILQKTPSNEIKCQGNWFLLVTSPGRCQVRMYRWRRPGGQTQISPFIFSWGQVVEKRVPEDAVEIPNSFSRSRFPNIWPCQRAPLSRRFQPQVGGKDAVNLRQLPGEGAGSHPRPSTKHLGVSRTPATSAPIHFRWLQFQTGREKRGEETDWWQDGGQPAWCCTGRPIFFAFSLII